LNRCLDNAIADAVTEFQFPARGKRCHPVQGRRDPAYRVPGSRASQRPVCGEPLAQGSRSFEHAGQRSDRSTLEAQPGCDGKSDRWRGQRCTNPCPRTSRNLVGSLFHCRCQGCRPTAGGREGLRSRGTGRRR
jgi:hypothetical protein